MTSSDGSARVRQTVPLLLVSDLEKSREFYCDGLGFQLTSRWEQHGKLAWCWLELGTAPLMLQQFEEPEDPAPSTWGKGLTLYFLCDDAGAIYRELQSRGVEVTAPAVSFYGMKQIFLSDPDGYQLCFENPVDDSPRPS